MTEEINPMRDLGFFPDKQVLIEPQGFMVPGNPARDLCESVIPNGAKFYDLLDRYDNVTTYVLNRTDTGHSGDVMRLIAPFLKAFGATDYSVLKFFKDGMRFNPGAEDCIRYLKALMPMYIDTVMYQHAADDICDKLDLNDCLAGASSLDLDHSEMTKKEARDLRKMAESIVKLKLPKTQYDLNVPLELSGEEVKLVTALDDVFINKFQSTEAQKMIGEMSSVGANEKAYSLLDIRKTTQIDLDGTMYVGGESIDFQVMDLIKDGNGLALSFNGTEFAVHGANVMVLSEDCTVAAFLGSVFYDTGIQGVFDLAESWSRDYLRNNDFPDNNLRNAVLAAPGKFPEVYRITRSNVDQLAERSENYRTKLEKLRRMRSAKAEN
ncbi:archaeal conserved hypothetical protein [Thermoplasmatales archaeon BRNA1]|nr:archaeal conserved hypothetical protein [Thermoplasmatales archaeon BRNA1]